MVSHSPLALRPSTPPGSCIEPVLRGKTLGLAANFSLQNWQKPGSPGAQGPGGSLGSEMESTWPERVGQVEGVVYHLLWLSPSCVV